MDALEIIKTAISTLKTVSITGIDWNLENTDLLKKLAKLGGIDENGITIDQSVLTGTIHIPVMRQQEYKDFVGTDDEPGIWTNLTITYDSMIAQFKVSFLNDDSNKTVLDIQYVDKGSCAVDPTTRQDDPIAIPIKQSTIENDFTFKGWDTVLSDKIFADRVINAVYTSTIRNYTVKYNSKGLTLQETVAPYGTYVKYEGDTPVYTAEEAAYKYNLFKGWDQSGYVNGDKTVNAVFDTCEYVDGYFNDKDLKDLSQVELYAMMKMGLEQKVLSLKDSFDFTLGVDFHYNDIEEEELISSTTVFDGTNHIDTGISIMDKDKDFTFAIDFEFDNENATGATLAQCFQGDGSNGFRLWYSQSYKFSWGTDSVNASSSGGREIIVIRHTTLYNAKIKAESASKPSSKPSTLSSKVAAAQSFNKSIAGTYKVKASNGLNLRYKPGDTSNSNLILTIPNGKSVANYGYYTTVNGVKWYLVTYKDTPGFVSSRYLVK